MKYTVDFYLYDKLFRAVYSVETGTFVIIFEDERYPLNEYAATGVFGDGITATASRNVCVFYSEGSPAVALVGWDGGITTLGSVHTSTERASVSFG